MSNLLNNIMAISVKDNFTIYAKWIKSLSIGKFIIYLLLTELISEVLQEIVTNNRNDNWLSNITLLFLLVTIGIKILYKNTPK